MWGSVHCMKNLPRCGVVPRWLQGPHGVVPDEWSLAIVAKWRWRYPKFKWKVADDIPKGLWKFGSDKGNSAQRRWVVLKFVFRLKAGLPGQGECEISRICPYTEP